MVTEPYKYHFQMLKGFELRLNMPGVFLTPVCHRIVKANKIHENDMERTDTKETYYDQNNLTKKHKLFK